MNWEKAREQLDNFKIPLALSLIGVVLIIGGMISSGVTSSASKVKEFPKESLVGSVSQISVDVSGAVVNPGVYNLGSESRVEDAIKAAGWFSEKANGEYISKYLNLAQKLADGMKIYIPPQGETGVQSAGLVAGVSAGSNSGPININNSSQSELEALPGIGPVTAAKIISGRPFQKIEDLLNRKIVSKSTFEKIKASAIAF